MNIVPETALCEPLLYQSSAHFRCGQYVDIVGVTGSIPVTPTIQAPEITEFSKSDTYLPEGSMNL